MSAAAVIPSLIPLIVVVAMRRAEARIHRQLADARAFQADASIPLSLSRSIDRRRLQGLIQGGAVHVTANSFYFLDTAGWDNYQRNRRRRAWLALSVVAALVGFVFAVAFVMR
ncbi:MAG: hypothetical protein NTV21_05170 [Planctomycetota bacterium]|nr:hypothetical protein [Planctomycetota bacterium]